MYSRSRGVSRRTPARNPADLTPGVAPTGVAARSGGPAAHCTRDARLQRCCHFKYSHSEMLGDSHEMSQPADAGLTQMGVAPIHGAVSGCPISVI